MSTDTTMKTEKPKTASSETVTVACKTPNGLILRLFKMEDVTEPVMGGGSRTFKQARQLPGQVVIKGNRTPYGVAPEHAIVGGYALTPNVPKDFMVEWLRQNAEHDAVVNKLIFIHDKADNAAAEAKEKAKTKSGLEPLDPNNLPIKGVKTAETKDEKAA